MKKLMIVATIAGVLMAIVAPAPLASVAGAAPVWSGTAAEITTKVQSGETLSTDSSGYTGWETWVEGHENEVEESQLSLGNWVKTTWWCEMTIVSVISEKNPGETAEEFHERHFAAVAEEAADCPPDL